MREWGSKSYICFNCDEYTAAPAFVQLCTRQYDAAFPDIVNIQLCPICQKKWFDAIAGFLPQASGSCDIFTRMTGVVNAKDVL